jgi:hypothetical protein
VGNLINGFGLFNTLASMAYNLFPDGGDFDRTIGALKYYYSQLILKFLDLATQGRLTDKALFGSPAEMASFSNSDQIVKITEIHRSRFVN